MVLDKYRLNSCSVKQELHLLHDFFCRKGAKSAKEQTSFEVDNKMMYLANTGNNILIFHWRTPGSAHCRYKWFDLEGAFIDPCTGARFSLDGSFLTGPLHRGLDRYSMRRDGGQIIVDLSNTIEGPENP